MSPGWRHPPSQRRASDAAEGIHRRFASCSALARTDGVDEISANPLNIVRNRRIHSIHAPPHLPHNLASSCAGTRIANRANEAERRRRIGRGNGTRLGDEPLGPGPDRGPRGAGRRVPCGRARTLAGHGKPRHVLNN